ncbi:MAG TPA: hypothetical protein PKE66_11065 [Pyrinomonadaceae bacterium]|nr:hypothetical protein [Pyrinomonadaceae bacterium]
MIVLKLCATFLTVGIVILGRTCPSANPEAESQKISIYESATKVQIVEPNSDVRIFPITKEKAFRIANDHWMKEGVEVRRMIVCNTGLSTRVISVPSMNELVLSRITGEIYRSHKLASDNREVLEPAHNGDIDTPNKAVDLATHKFQRYFEETVGGNVRLADANFAVVCDLGSAWRIDYYPKELNGLTGSDEIGRLPNHHLPDFVIEKSTGRVLYFSSRDGTIIESPDTGGGAATK